MANFSDFIYGPGWAIQWAKDSNDVTNPVYPVKNVMLIVPSAQGWNQADLIWVDDKWKRHDLMGIPFDVQNGWLAGDGCKDSSDDAIYKVKVEIISPGQPGKIKGSISPTQGIAPVAGTWGADANGG
jgi:hypothetical protein